MVWVFRCRLTVLAFLCKLTKIQIIMIEIKLTKAELDLLNELLYPQKVWMKKPVESLRAKIREEVMNNPDLGFDGDGNVVKRKKK